MIIEDIVNNEGLKLEVKSSGNTVIETRTGRCGGEREQVALDGMAVELNACSARFRNDRPEIWRWRSVMEKTGGATFSSEHAF